MIQYSAKLTDKQWQVIEKIINTQERKLKHFFRNIMNAILYFLKTGCKWCMIPKRWIVERFFAWLENFRRLTIDYEYNADTAVVMVQLAFCKIMLNKFIG